MICAGLHANCVSFIVCVSLYLAAVRDNTHTTYINAALVRLPSAANRDTQGGAVAAIQKSISKTAE